MKIVGIVTVGTYPVPWLKYCLASIYHIVDRIIVVNSGYNFPYFTEYDHPLADATHAIKQIDINGKIDEVQHARFESCDLVQSEREGLRALGGTFASEYARKYSPEWLLQFDSDQVFFANVRNIHQLTTKDTDGYQFLQYLAYWITPWHCIPPELLSSYSDGAKFYRYGGKGGERQWWLGEGGIMNYREQKPCDLVTTAHFRECYPTPKGQPPDYDSAFYYQFRRAMFHLFDRNRLHKLNQSMQDIIVGAFNVAKEAVYERTKAGLFPAPIPPPEVVEIGPEKYVKEGFPK